MGASLKNVNQGWKSRYVRKQGENKPDTPNGSANPNGRAGGDKHCKQAEVGDPSLAQKFAWESLTLYMF